jgi:hypothetical protein
MRSIQENHCEQCACLHELFTNSLEDGSKIASDASETRAVDLEWACSELDENVAKIKQIQHNLTTELDSLKTRPEFVTKHDVAIKGWKIILSRVDVLLWLIQGYSREAHAAKEYYQQTTMEEEIFFNQNSSPVERKGSNLATSEEKMNSSKSS